MEFRNMKTFMRVAELQSFTKAAEELGYSQSTVTVQIKQLEQELDVLLFERIGKNVRLTEQGRTFWHQAREILHAVDQLRSSLGDENQVRGTLRVGTVDSLCSNRMPYVLQEFRRHCPLVETVVRTGSNEALYDMIQKNEVDLIYFLDRRQYRDDWIKVMEKEEKAYFAAAAEHPLTKEGDVTLTEILAQPLLLTERGMSYRRSLEAAVAMEGLELRPVLEMENTDIIVKLVCSNAGVAYFPEFIIEKQVQEGVLAVIPCQLEAESVWSQLVYHKDKLLTPQMKIFMDILQGMDFCLTLHGDGAYSVRRDS